MFEKSFIAGAFSHTQVSAQQESAYTQAFASITQRMAAALQAGAAANSDEMQLAVREHYDFICQFWVPNRETYKALALSYILPTEYKDHYEEVSAGLGQYIYEAVCAFADANLPPAE